MGNSCGFCVKAEKLLDEHIKKGTIVKKPASEAQGQFSGFPAFVSEVTGKTSLGCPSSYEDLVTKLGHTQENYYTTENPYRYNAMVGSTCIGVQGIDKRKFCCAIAEECPTGCMIDWGGECVPVPDSGGGGVSSPHTCPKHGNVICKVNGECELTGLEDGGHNPCSDNLCWSPQTDDAIKACNHYHGLSYQCSPGLGCHLVNKPPGHGPGGIRYASAQECDKVCDSKPPLGKFSYQCSPGLGCHLVNKPPGHGPGGIRYASAQECNSRCKKGCTIDSCPHTKYCSKTSKKCINTPNNWTSDFYNSVVQETETESKGALSSDKAKCIVNGLASSKGCNITNPADSNISTPNPKFKKCMDGVMRDCETTPTKYRNSPVKSSGGGGSKKGSDNRGMYIGIGIGVLVVLVILGYIIYRHQQYLADLEIGPYQK